jgi:hypothetical protein
MKRTPYYHWNNNYLVLKCIKNSGALHFIVLAYRMLTVFFNYFWISVVLELNWTWLNITIHICTRIWGSCFAVLQYCNWKLQYQEPSEQKPVNLYYILFILNQPYWKTYYTKRFAKLKYLNHWLWKISVACK